VSPKQVPGPKQSPLPLAAHLLHNLAHVELNAIDLAWDTVARFSHLRLPDGARMRGAACGVRACCCGLLGCMCDGGAQSGSIACQR
jgi:hypothetical protein